MKKVIVTGPTGAIGIALIDQCIKNEVKVTAVCHKDSKRIVRLPKSDLVKIVLCDLNEMELLPEIVGDTGYDTFFHLGWDGTFGKERNRIWEQIDNIRYTVDSVKSAHLLGCKKFLGAGSQAEYGRKMEKLTSEMAAFPENAYGMAKLCAGMMSRKLCGELGMDHIWTRILSVYGPNDNPHSLIMYVINELILGEEPQLTKGEQLWDYLYSEDAGMALYLLGEKGISGNVYVLGSGTARPLMEYIKIIRNQIDPNLNLGFGKIPYGSEQVMHLEADISKLKKDTGFSVKYSFEEGVRKTIHSILNLDG